MYRVACTLKISIHALREEGDCPSFSKILSRYTISIHALREEGDTPLCFEPLRNTIFLSTPSARRATHGAKAERPLHPISIHALREEGDPPFLEINLRADISIHALREEGDSKNRDKISIFKQIIHHSARI